MRSPSGIRERAQYFTRLALLLVVIARAIRKAERYKQEIDLGIGEKPNVKLHKKTPDAEDLSLHSLCKSLSVYLLLFFHLNF